MCLDPILPLGKAGGPTWGLFGCQANFNYYFTEIQLNAKGDLSERRINDG